MKYEYEITDNRILSVLADENIYNYDLSSQLKEEYEAGNSTIYLYFEICDYDYKYEKHFFFPRSFVKKEILFDSDGWNPFPQLLPAEHKSYLTQSGNNEFAIYGWSKGNSEEENRVRWEALNVVAFRELPPPCDPKEL